MTNRIELEYAPCWRAQFWLGTQLFRLGAWVIGGNVAITVRGLLPRQTLAPGMKNFWVSWFHDPNKGMFEMRTPWWTRDDYLHGPATIVAAICAADEGAAKGFVLAAYNPPLSPAGLAWRFCKEVPDDWAPFGEHFPRAPWMQWDGQPSRHQ